MPYMKCHNCKTHNKCKPRPKYRGNALNCQITAKHPINTNEYHDCYCTSCGASDCKMIRLMTDKEIIVFEL